MQKNSNYKAAGVDIEAGEQFVEAIKPLAKTTQHPNVLSGIGGFGALYELPLKDYREPVLVSTTDGVGTKLKLAIERNQHTNIGIDLVAMCANDLIVSGAKPLFFLDYYATGKLDLKTSQIILSSIAEGCRQAELALVGGETAEMPGMYQHKDYDLAGFAVGIVEKDKILGAHRVQVGDAVIGIASNGFHSNGYSLIRQVIAEQEIDLNLMMNGKTLADLLLKPTRIYVKLISALLNKIKIHAMAHITGGGIPGNLVRVLPEYTAARINADGWYWPEEMQLLQREGNILFDEMLQTFNCGVGMMLILPQDQVVPCLEIIAEQNDKAWLLGQIEKSAEKEPAVRVG